MRYADTYLKLMLPGTSQEMRVTGSNGRLDLNLAVGAYRAVETVYTTFGRMGQSLRLWKARRRALESLSRLDDHLLRDIGLRRDQLPAFIEQLATQRTASGASDARPGFSMGPSADGTSLNA